MYYTLGQRQGLGIGGLQGGSDEPWYVVDKDTSTNALIVAQGDTDLLLSDSVAATEPNWINGPPEDLERGYACNCKVRYRQDDQGCTVETGADGALVVRFEDAQRAVAPGQYVVFYDADRCLGGAVIDQISRIRAAGSAIMRPPGDLAGNG